jgi:2-hydroxycyclohexanecarboxyl-CoA dehydrogenase
MKYSIMQDMTTSAVLLTGGTSGIGLASAMVLASQGVRQFMLVGRSVNRAAHAAETLLSVSTGLDVQTVSADVATPDGASKAAAACVEAFGRIDALVSSSGGDATPKLISEMTIEEMHITIGTITSGVVLPARAVLPQMMAQGCGSIVCIASDAAKVATPGEVAIGAAMGAIVSFCRNLAIEAKRSGIRVNAVTPSIVRGTPLYDKVMSEPFASKLFLKAESMAHLGVVEADDVAELIAFLVGSGSSRLTGQAISVNGGISAA